MEQMYEIVQFAWNRSPPLPVDRSGGKVGQGREDVPPTFDPIRPAPAAPWHRRTNRSMGGRMDAPRQYRQQESFCLRLASEASEEYVRAALTELAADYRHRAEDA